MGSEETVLGQSEIDKERLSRVATGDQEALRQLYDSYASHLNSFVQNYLADPQEAADIVHEAMLDVWRTADRFRGGSTVKSWMFSIARNKAIDRNRKGARSVLGDIDADIPDDSPDPHKTLEAFQDAERVRVCIDGLNAVQKSAIHLAFYEDFSYSQIAEIEDCPTGTVKTRIMAAKAALMRCLQRSE
jgi:RNA polymerase sigma-70 factor (ECF subfamily)